jgi:hypothetical protein
MPMPKGLTELAVRAVVALERIAEAAEAIDRGMTQQRLGAASRERINADRTPDDIRRAAGLPSVEEFVRRAAERDTDTPKRRGRR